MEKCEHLICNKVYQGGKWLLVCSDCIETQRELSKEEVEQIVVKNNQFKKNQRI